MNNSLYTRYQCYVDNTHDKYIKTFDEWLNS